MKTRALILAVAASSWLFAQDANVQQELDALKKSQDALQKQLEENQKRIENLEKASPAAPQDPAKAGEAPKDTAKAGYDSAAKPSEESGWVRWNELVFGDSKLKLYGRLRFDLIFDESRPNNTQSMGFVRSEDSNLGGKNGREDLTMHPRLTQLGIDFDGPTIEPLGSAELSGKLELDFFNEGANPAASRVTVRLRQAWLKLYWSKMNISLLAGQTYDVASPVQSLISRDYTLWNTGDIGYWRPQLRLEVAPKLGFGNVVAQIMIGLTGAVDRSDLDSPGSFGSGYSDGETSGLPTLQARLGYEGVFSEGWNKLQFGVWGFRAWEDPDERINGRDRFDSWGYGADLVIPVYEDICWIKGEIWEGENLDDMRGGIFQGVNATTGDEVRSRGGFIEVGFKPFEFWTTTGGYSMDDPNNHDLGSAAMAVNKIWYFGNHFTFDSFSFGVDYMYWKTDYTDFQSGDDNRFQAFIQYSF